MSKETGRSCMGTIELLGVLLTRPCAVLALRFSNIPRPVSYNEFQARLDDRFAAHKKAGPSESEVKTQLDFLVEQNLLEVKGLEYQITPRGAKASTALSPVTERRPVKAS